VLEEKLSSGDGFGGEFLNTLRSIEPFAIDLEDLLFSSVEQFGDIDGMVKDPLSGGGADMEKASSKVEIPQYFQVIIQAGRGRGGVRELCDILLASNGLETVHVVEAIGQGNNVDWFAFVTHIKDCLEYGAMANVVECVRSGTDPSEEQVDPFGGIQEKATKDGLFCFDRMRGQSVEPAGAVVLRLGVEVRLRRTWLVLLRDYCGVHWTGGFGNDLVLVRLSCYRLVFAKAILFAIHDVNNKVP